MKKIALLLLSFVVCISFCFAGDFTFELVPDSGPLFKEPFADPYSFVSRIHAQKALNLDERLTKIKAAVEIVDSSSGSETSSKKTDYIMLPVDDRFDLESDTYNTYLDMRLGVAVALARIRFDSEKFPSIDAELTLGGALNTLFMLYSSSASLGFDGTWMVGASVRVGDVVTLRGGMHHFSGHYGDEILDNFYSRNGVDFNDSRKINANFDGKEDGKEYYIHNLVEYVRDNSWIIGASVDLPFGLRFYGELEWPFKNVWLRPFSSTPAGHNTQDGISLIEYVGGASEGFTEEQIQKEIELKTGTGYNALRAHIGTEFSFDICKDVAAFISMDVQFHQDGQTKHMPNAYSPNNPWEWEFSVSGGVELGEFLNSRSIRIELGYHNGRVSTTNWFYQRCEVAYIGLAIS